MAWESAPGAKHSHRAMASLCSDAMRPHGMAGNRPNPGIQWAGYREPTGATMVRTPCDPACAGSRRPGSPARSNPCMRRARGRSQAAAFCGSARHAHRAARSLAPSLACCAGAPVPPTLVPAASRPRLPWSLTSLPSTCRRTSGSRKAAASSARSSALSGGAPVRSSRTTSQPDPRRVSRPSIAAMARPGASPVARQDGSRGREDPAGAHGQAGQDQRAHRHAVRAGCWRARARSLADAVKLRLLVLFAVGHGQCWRAQADHCACPV